MPRRDEYKLRVLQEAAVGGCNGDHSGYNISGYYDGSGYNVGGYAMIVCSTLHKQLRLGVWGKFTIVFALYLRAL